MRETVTNQLAFYWPIFGTAGWLLYTKRWKKNAAVWMLLLVFMVMGPFGFFTSVVCELLRPSD